MNSYRYSESAGPWWVDRQRKRNVTSALPFFKSMTSVLEVKSTNVRGIKEFWGSLSVQVWHKESRSVPVVALDFEPEVQGFLISCNEAFDRLCPRNPDGIPREVTSSSAATHFD